MAVKWSMPGRNRTRPPWQEYASLYVNLYGVILRMGPIWLMSRTQQYVILEGYQQRAPIHDVTLPEHTWHVGWVVPLTRSTPRIFGKVTKVGLEGPGSALDVSQ